MAAFVVAAVAALGNLLQGWDGGAIAGLGQGCTVFLQFGGLDLLCFRRITA